MKMPMMPVAYARLRADGFAPDGALLSQFADRRDEAAFEALVRRHGPLVWSVAARHAADHHAAEDVFQATFLTLARLAGRLSRSGPLGGWLHTVAIRFARKTHRFGRRHQVTDPPDVPAPRTALDDLTGRELMAVVDQEVSRLPDRYRLPVVLCCLQGLARDEAAADLGWSFDSLKGRLERGRELLRQRLSARGLALPVTLGATLLVPLIVPTVLRAETARAAVRFAAGPMPGTAAVLASEMVRRHGWTGFGKVAAAIVAAAGLTVGLGLGSGQPPGSPTSPTPPVPPPPVPVVKKDRQGDPLPAGAVLRLGTTRLRHANLFALAFTADGKLISFGGDYTVRAWNPATGQLLRERGFEKETMHRFWGGCLSPDGKRVAIQKSDRMKVFETESGKELASVKLASAYEGRAQFSPDGQFLAVVDQDGKGKSTRMLLCDVETNTTRELCKVQGYSSDPVFSRNGRRVALAEWTQAGVGVWEVATGKELLRFKPVGLLGGTVDFDPTGDVLAVLGAVNPPQSFHYAQISTGQPPEGWTTPPVSDFNWVRFSPDGSSILFGGRKSLQWCDPKTGKVMHTAEGWSATPPAFSPDGRLVASGGESAIRMWQLESGRSADPDQDGNAFREEIHGVSVSPDGKWILTKGDSATIRIWDSAGQMKGNIKSTRWARYPRFSPDGRHLFGGPANAIALVRWDFPDGKESARYTFAEPAKDHVAVLDFGLSADGKRLAALTQTTNRKGPGPAGGGGAPRGGEVVTWTVWDVATARRLTVRELPGGYAERSPLFGYGAFSPDLRWYYSGDKAIASEGESDLRLELPAEWIFPRQAAISPDGRLVAQMIGERQGGKVNPGQAVFRRVTINETATGQQVLSMPIGFCGPLAFTPDCRALIVSDPNAITRWDLVTHKAVVGHKSPIPFNGSYGNSFASSLTLTPDGARAVTGHRDTTALVWDLTPPARRVMKLADRELAAAWDDLAGNDAAKAYAAIWSLADAPSDALAFFRGRVRPATGLSDEQSKALIAKLDAPGFAAREAAEKELRDFGEAAVPALRAALDAKLSGEQKTRVERLLAAATAPAVGAGDHLRQLRAVAVLEMIETDEARKLLKELAGGPAGTRLTTESSESLGRLSRRVQER
ncbi:MAG TPA: sigma-70 family RNA polymerase sigma factor [Gemmataceae bacterium]|nr:sigma-70 family RNA polymerase sigma factor [Gemmataceae bacterium]